MKVLINGAGIAGNALAYWLTRLGHQVTVVERFPTLRATGLQLDLRGHGIEVLRRMGLEAAFRAKAAPEQGLQLVNSSGARLAYFPANKSGKGLQNFSTNYEIMRGDLCRLMYDQTKDRAHYVFGTTVESFEDRGDTVDVRFSDGKAECFDLLVGADGQGSRIRSLLLGPRAPASFHPVQGMYVGYFTVPQTMREGEEYDATWYLTSRRRFVMTRRHSPDTMQVYLICTSDSETLKNARRGDVAREKDGLAEIFRGAGWRADELVDAMYRSTDFYMERLGLVKMARWFQGRVALVGDAAYCPSTFTGMGTTSAMVGAYVLAGEISEHCRAAGRESEGEGEGGGKAGKDLEDVLRAYDARFRPFMDQVQRGISESSGFSLPTSSWGIALFNRMMGLAAVLKINFIGQYILRENVKWELPEYKGLLRDEETVPVQADEA